MHSSKSHRKILGFINSIAVNDMYCKKFATGAMFISYQRELLWWESQDQLDVVEFCRVVLCFFVSCQKQQWNMDPAWLLDTWMQGQRGSIIMSKDKIWNKLPQVMDQLTFIRLLN